MSLDILQRAVGDLSRVREIQSRTFFEKVVKVLKNIGFDQNSSDRFYGQHTQNFLSGRKKYAHGRNETTDELRLRFVKVVTACP